MHHSFKEIDVPDGTATFAADLELDSGETMRITVVDPEGKPLTDLNVGGRTSLSPKMSPVEQPTFDLQNLAAGETRMLLIHHEKRNLGKAALVKFDPNAPRQMTVALEPCATVTGRVLTAEGDRVTRGTLHVSSTASGVGSFAPKLAEVPLDNEGRFRFTGLLPGCDYVLVAHTPVGAGTLSGFLSEKLAIKPGEAIDLGDVRMKQPGAGGTADAATTKSPEREAKTATIRGQVLAPNGKPAAGATVRAAAPMWAMMEEVVGRQFETPMSETIADVQGRFSISFSTEPFGDVSRLDDRWKNLWKKSMIAASLGGYGPAWVEYDEIDSKQPLTLRLVEDLPIRGRVIDLEGKPVSGTSIKMGDLRMSRDDDVSPWIAGAKAGELPWIVYGRASRSVDLRLIGVPASVTTKSDGTLEIRGLGKERLVELTFGDEFVASRHATLVTRAMPTFQRRISQTETDALQPVYGAEFTFIADPARIVEGVVRDAKTREPLPGVEIKSYKLVGYPYSNHRILKTTSDAQGRFRLVGMPKGKGNRLLIVPNDEQPFFMREVDVPDPVGLGPATMEIELHRGVWITGRVTDKVSREPVPGVRLHYLAFLSNAHARAFPEFRDGRVDGDQTRYRTKADGTYRLVGLPGRAVVGAESVMRAYRRGVGFDEIAEHRQQKVRSFDLYYMNPIPPSRSWPSVMREIDPPADAKSVSLDFELDPGDSVRLRVVDSAGNPAPGTTVTGSSATDGLETISESIVVATNFSPGEERSVLFRNEEKQIGRVVRVGPDEIRAGEMTVVLQPYVIVTGRVLKSENEPAAGAEIEAWILPSGDFGKRLPSMVTDSDGRFRMTLLPGCQYNLQGTGVPRQVFTIAKTLTVEPGKTIDLGDVRINDAKQPQASSDAAPAPNKNSVAITIRGQVRSPDGKPAAKAHVAAIAASRQVGRGGDLSSDSRVLAQAVTDDNGRFEMKISGVSSKTHREGTVIARATDSGFAWIPFDLDASDVEVSFELAAEQPIRGRLVDIEGQPAPKVHLSVTSVIDVPRLENRNGGLNYHDFGNHPPAAWPESVTADETGKFTFRGIAAGHGLVLKVTGTDRFALQWLNVNTGASEQRSENDLTYRDQVKNAKPGDEVLLALAPVQIFEGTVRYADTNEPAPHARLTIGSSQQEVHGSSYSIAGQADAQGRFRLNPTPGVRFRILAYPPDGTPYLTRAVRDIARKEAGPPRQVDVTLPRGVLIRGRVVEAGTNTPVAGAAIQYVPERRNNPNAKDDIVTEWQAIEISGDDGRFQIVVLPGPGTLLAQGPKSQFVLQEIGSNQLSRGIPGGWRYYTHAFRRVNPEPQAEPIDVTMELRRGASVAGRITNGDGEPVERALIITRLNTHPSSLEWRGFPMEALGGRFELSGLADGPEYPVYFLDVKNRLGATLNLKSTDKSPTVVLAPCGEATATFVDPDGKPNVKYSPSFEIVATPGPHKFDAAVMNHGALSGDSAYVSNIDRTNYAKYPKTDATNRTVYPALIPGARYRITTYVKGLAINLKEFIAESNKNLDLGTITIPNDDRE